MSGPHGPGFGRISWTHASNESAGRALTGWRIAALVAVAALVCVRRRASGGGGSGAGASARVALGPGGARREPCWLGRGRTLAAQPVAGSQLDPLARTKWGRGGGRHHHRRRAGPRCHAAGSIATRRAPCTRDFLLRGCSGRALPG